MLLPQRVTPIRCLYEEPLACNRPFHHVHIPASPATKSKVPPSEGPRRRNLHRAHSIMKPGQKREVSNRNEGANVSFLFNNYLISILMGFSLFCPMLVPSRFSYPGDPFHLTLKLVLNALIFKTDVLIKLGMYEEPGARLYVH